MHLVKITGKIVVDCGTEFTSINKSLHSFQWHMTWLLSLRCILSCPVTDADFFCCLLCSLINCKLSACSSIVGENDKIGYSTLHFLSNFLGSQSVWVMVRMKHNPKHSPKVHHQPLHVSNRFSPLSHKPAEQPTLVTGSSII